MSRMTPQRTTTLDFIDPKIPPLPRPPNTALDSPQRPRSGAAAAARVSSFSVVDLAVAAYAVLLRLALVGVAALALGVGAWEPKVAKLVLGPGLKAAKGRTLPLGPARLSRSRRVRSAARPLES